MSGPAPLHVLLQDRASRPVLLLLGPRRSSGGGLVATAWYAYRKLGRGTHLEAPDGKYALATPTTSGLHSGPLWRAQGVPMKDEEIALEVRA